MKLLIYTLPRTGCTSLMYGIKSLLDDFFIVNEPYISSKNNIFNKDNITKTPNLILKTCVEDLPLNLKLNMEEFGEYLISFFDHVVFIDRKSYQEHFESYLHMLFCHKNNLLPIKPYKLTKKDLDFYQTQINIEAESYNFNLQKNILNNLSKKLNIPILYYEDIYQQDISLKLKTLQHLKLDVDYLKLANILNTSDKLRKNNMDEDEYDAIANDEDNRQTVED